MKIAVSTSSFGTLDSTPLNMLSDNGFEVIDNPFHRKLTEEEIIIHLQGVDGLIAGLEPLTENVFNNCPQLKAIARVGIGMDNVDSVAANAHGIKVSNTPEGPTNAVAEMTLAAALCLVRQIIPANRAMHNNEWAKTIGKSLKNTPILIIGYGRIGRRVAELFMAFGAEIFITDPAIKQEDLILNEKWVELNEGLRRADIITIHAGGKDPILDRKNIINIKHGTIIMNSARGNLIDEAALLEGLNSGRISSAWLDVFHEEPYSGDLSKHENVLLTPHMSTYSIQCRKDMEIKAVQNLIADLENGKTN
jgi:D-3-phosphoglycerate dehydrogenase / 2-oxoglutarate reductase